MDARIAPKNCQLIKYGLEVFCEITSRNLFQHGPFGPSTLQIGNVIYQLIQRKRPWLVPIEFN